MSDNRSMSITDAAKTLSALSPFPAHEEGLTAELEDENDENGMVFIKRKDGSVKMAMSREDYDALRAWKPKK